MLLGAIRHFYCSAEGCGHSFEKYVPSSLGADPSVPCKLCGAPSYRMRLRGRAVAVDPKERVVIYENPLTGQTNIPMRNDTPIPEKLAEAGFVRRELTTIAEVRAFERERGKISEVANYDRNSSARRPDEGYGENGYEPGHRPWEKNEKKFWE